MTAARARALLARHWPFLVVLAAAAVLRAAAWLAVHPAWWILGDSISYLEDAVHLAPDRWRPGGYSLMLLWPLLPAHSLALVTAVQHLLGLGAGALVYALLLRLGLPRWAAALAGLPVLFDGYVLATEQMLASEALFGILVLGALAVLLRRPGRPSELAAYAAGTLLGLATLTRIVGLPLIAVAALVLLLPRPAWSRAAALCLPFAVVVGGYALWFSHVYGEVDLTASSGIFLYGRTTNFVDCGRVPFTSDRLRQLCPTEPVGRRNEIWYVFDEAAPIARMGLSATAANKLAGQFASEAIRAQPDGYALLVRDGLVESFAWDQSSLPDDMRFRSDQHLPAAALAAAAAYQSGDPGPVYVRGLVGALDAYQGVAHVPAPVCLLALAVAAAGLLFGRDPHGRGLRAALLLTGGAAAVLLMIPAMTAIVAPRYRVPAIPALCLAAAIGCTLLVNRWSAWREEARARRAAPAAAAGR